MLQVPLQNVLDLVADAIDAEVLERGRRRQTAVWLGDEPDYLPLLLGHTERFFKNFKEDRTWKMAEHELVGGVVCPEMWEYPHYTFTEQQEDPKKMLYEMLWEILSWARSRSDAVLSVRAYYLRTFESALGMDIERSEESHAYVRKFLPAEEVYNLDPGDIFERGLFPKVAECIELMKQHLPEGVHIFPGDTGGPLSLAEALRGNEIWYDFYDRPEDVRALLGKCTELSKQAVYWYKQKLGDPRDQTYHGSLFQAKGGVRVVGDSIVNISPEMHREFVIDLINEIFAEFDGGWFHSCGYYPNHLDDLLAVPAMTAINFGNPEQWPDFEKTLRRIIDAGKIYYGGLPVRNGDYEEAMRSALRASRGRKRGMIVFLQGESPWPEPEKLMDTWHAIQDNA